MRGGVQDAVSLRTGVGARERGETAELEEVHRALLRALRAREREMVDAIFARVSSMFMAARGEDADYETGLRETVAAVVNHSLTEIEAPAEQPAPIPSAAIAQAQRAARRNISVETMMLRYIAGHRVLGGFVMDEAHRSGLSSNGPALRHLRTTQEALLERLMTRIADEYRQERERIERSREQCHVEVVQKLLAGESPDTAGLEYDLDDAWHLGMIANGQGGRRVVRGLADDLGRQLLCVSTGEDSVWAWIGGRQELEMARVERALSATRTVGVTLVLGQPRRAMSGWRLTHREAQAALLVAQRRPESTVRFADHALLALVLQNESLVRSLAGIYLPSLGNPVARETVRAYFSAGCNAATAAAKLAIDRHTVERRLRAIEGNLGRQLRSCHAELEVVLRLEELGVTPNGDTDPETAR
ncbi:MAG TPA: helix-turn-helix domain-containing protein [Solirubrobacteraceae bacterium]